MIRHLLFKLCTFENTGLCIFLHGEKDGIMKLYRITNDALGTLVPCLSSHKSNLMLSNCVIPSSLRKPFVRNNIL